MEEDEITDEGEAAQRARADYEGMLEALRRMRHRKSTRNGDLPAEIWKLLLCERKVQHPRTKQVKEREVSQGVRREIWEDMQGV